MPHDKQLQSEGRRHYATEFNQGQKDAKAGQPARPDGSHPYRQGYAFACNLSEDNRRTIAAAPALLEALRAVLLFHRGGPWDEATCQEWNRLTGQEEATTRKLCDAVRAAIAQATGETEPDEISEEIENEKELTRVDREIAEERHAEELQRRHDA